MTHRDFTSSVHIITGHKKQDEPLSMNFKALAELGGTLVFLMGVSAAEDICRGLISGGMDPSMPAAILQKGTTSEQRRLVSDLENLPRRITEEKIETPAIIVVGRVCTLAESFAWMEKKELFGCRVVITRPKDRTSQLTDRLRARGAQVIELPAIRTRAIPDNGQLAEALEQIRSWKWIVFTSPAGVHVFMDALRERRMDVRALADARIASLGPGTSRELSGYGIYPDLMPQTYDGEHLGRELAERLADGDRVLLPRAAKGNPEIAAAITGSGAFLADIPIYETLFVRSRVIDEKAEFTQHPQTMAVFTSASTVRGFLETVDGMDVSGIRACCIGRQTAAAAAEAGMRIYIAEKATLESLEELVCRVFWGEI